MRTEHKRTFPNVMSAREFNVKTTDCVTFMDIFYCDERMLNSPVAILDIYGNSLGGSSSSSCLFKLSWMLPPTGQYCNVIIINNNNVDNSTEIVSVCSISDYVTWFPCLAIYN